MSHLTAKKLPNGKIIMYDKNTKKNRGLPMKDTPENHAKIQMQDEKEDKAMGNHE